MVTFCVLGSDRMGIYFESGLRLRGTAIFIIFEVKEKKSPQTAPLLSSAPHEFLLVHFQEGDGHGTAYATAFTANID